MKPLRSVRRARPRGGDDPSRAVGARHAVARLRVRTHDLYTFRGTTRSRFVRTRRRSMIFAADAQLRLDANWVDYLLIALYFCFVLGIGILAKRSVSSSIDFF